MKKPTLLIVLANLILICGCARLVFVSERDGNAQIYKMRVTGASQTNISNNRFIDHFPDVSSDSKKIAFSSLRDTPGENIYVMDIDGRNVQQVTTGDLQRTHPRWSPLGLIAFAYPYL
jgi:TolB protein